MLKRITPKPRSYDVHRPKRPSYQLPTKRPWTTSEINILRPFAALIMDNRITRKQSSELIRLQLPHRSLEAVQACLKRLEAKANQALAKQGSNNDHDQRIPICQNETTDPIRSDPAEPV